MNIGRANGEVMKAQTKQAISALFHTLFGLTTCNVGAAAGGVRKGHTVQRSQFNNIFSMCLTI